MRNLTRLWLASHHRGPSAGAGGGSSTGGGDRGSNATPRATSHGPRKSHGRVEEHREPRLHGRGVGAAGGQRGAPEKRLHALETRTGEEKREEEGAGRKQVSDQLKQTLRRPAAGKQQPFTALRHDQGLSGSLEGAGLGTGKRKALGGGGLSSSCRSAPRRAGAAHGPLGPPQG